jgi:precorrin-6B methylase 2
MFLNLIRRAATLITSQEDNRVIILDELYGSARSIHEKAPVDPKGRALPWFTYPAIEYLSRLDFKNATFFEFGCGYGTIYWAKYCKKIVSVESDLGWFEKLKKRTIKSKNIELVHADDRTTYINAIKKTKKKFDVIIVDGVYRDGCTLNALESLKEGGLIILDNSDWYANSARILRKAGYTQIDFDGFGPGNKYTWVTSIFFKTIKFDHTEKNYKNFSKGGYKKVVDSK